MTIFKDFCSIFSVSIFFKCALVLLFSHPVNAIGVLDGEVSVDESKNGICRASILFEKIDQETISDQKEVVLASSTGFLITPPPQRPDLQKRLLIFPAHAFVGDSSDEKKGLTLLQEGLQLYFTSTTFRPEIKSLIFHPNFKKEDDFVDQVLVILSDPVDDEEEVKLSYDFSSIEEEDCESVSEGDFIAWGPKSVGDEALDNYEKRKVAANIFKDSESYSSRFGGEEISYQPRRIFYTSGLKKCEKGSQLSKEGEQQISEFYTLSGDSGGCLLIHGKVALLTASEDLPLDEQGDPYEIECEEALNPSILFQTNVYQLVDTQWIQDILQK
ncbi:MAG TPA: hypothetical protein VMW10_01890 [Alphaproteobacteria bacterium]|nr:hypothetical protein [Alphaproteobacteria bacterium]